VLAASTLPSAESFNGRDSQGVMTLWRNRQVLTEDQPMRTPRRMDTKTLDERVRQHGGILEAIEWGIRSDSIEDPELATVWRGIEAHYEKMRRRLALASRMLANDRRGAIAGTPPRSAGDDWLA
jgi:hypothetical protein